MFNECLQNSNSILKRMADFFFSLTVLKEIGTEHIIVKVKSLSHIRLFATPWTVAHQAPPSMEFSRQEYWSGLPFPSPGDLPINSTK